MEIKKIDCVECEKCGKIFKIESKEYVTIYGNICKGQYGGVIGNNLDGENKIKKVSIFCNSCFEEILADANILGVVGG